MSKPSVSIILPAHNRADVVGFSIRSCLAQTFGDFELLITGDGCTDETAAVVTSFRDDRIRWFDRPKAPGYGYSHRNFALREARGEFIAWQQHDDLWMPDHLEQMLEKLRQPGVDFVHSRPMIVNPDGFLCPACFLLNNPETLSAFLRREDSMLASSCIMHRRDCVERVGFWNETLLRQGDLEFWIRIIEGGGRTRFAVLDEVTTLHFFAIWPDAPRPGPVHLEPWLALHRGGGEASQRLRVPIPPGTSEQKIIYDLMSESDDWPSRIREAVRRADLLRLAQADVHSFHANRVLGDKRAEIAAAGERIEDGVKRIQVAEMEIAAMQQTLSWRITAPLRALKRVLSGRS